MKTNKTFKSLPTYGQIESGVFKHPNIMLPKIQTKFYTFTQNNSGGYFIEDDKYGVAEYVVIEATKAEDAVAKLEGMVRDVPNMFAYCECCGERWPDWINESDGKQEPMIYDTPIERFKKGFCRNRAFVHYLDGQIKEFVFAE